MVFGRRKEERVIEEEDEHLARAKLLAEVATNIDIIGRYADTFIKVNLGFWEKIKNDANVPDNLKFEMWKHSVSEFWETVRSGGIFTLSETMKQVGQMIRAIITKALEEAG